MEMNYSDRKISPLQAHVTPVQEDDDKECNENRGLHQRLVGEEGSR